MLENTSLELKTKAKNYVLSNPLLRKIALSTLSTPLVVDNPIYKHILQRQIHLSGDFNKIPLCNKCSFRDVWWLY